MKTFIIISSLLVIVSTFIVALAELNNKKSIVLIGALLILVFGVVSLILQHIQQTKDGEEIARVNGLLLKQTGEAVGYASGGEDNRPLVNFSFLQNPDSSFTVVFHVLNLGKFPLNNVFFEINDSYSLDYDYRSKHQLASPSQWTPEQIMSMNKYRMEHQDQMNIHGTLGNLPRNFGMKIHEGKVTKDMPALMYLIKLAWNNQYYTATYQLAKDSTTNTFNIFAINVMDADGKQVTDLQKFFPLVPKEYWGAFPTKVDTTPKTYQFNSH